MEKRILIGSIIAVTILVLVSFTGVVGYQTTKSSAIAKASPLFTIRSKRAIDKESKGLTCEYVGKGEETNIQLSSRIRRAEQVQNAINIISKIGDKAFSKMVARIILNLKSQEQMTNTGTSEALQILHNMRRNPNDMQYYDMKDIPIPTLEYITCYGAPLCIIFSIMFVIELILLYIAGWITSRLTCSLVCRTVLCDI